MIILKPKRTSKKNLVALDLEEYIRKERALGQIEKMY